MTDAIHTYLIEMKNTLIMRTMICEWSPEYFLEGKDDDDDRN